jgi:hypothetical protein
MGKVLLHLLVESARYGYFTNKVVFTSNTSIFTFLLIMDRPEHVSEVVSRAALKPAQLGLEVQPFL